MQLVCKLQYSLDHLIPNSRLPPLPLIELKLYAYCLQCSRARRIAGYNAASTGKSPGQMR